MYQAHKSQHLLQTIQINVYPFTRTKLVSCCPIRYSFVVRCLSHSSGERVAPLDCRVSQICTRDMFAHRTYICMNRMCAPTKAPRDSSQMYPTSPSQIKMSHASALTEFATKVKWRVGIFYYSVQHTWTVCHSSRSSNAMCSPEGTTGGRADLPMRASPSSQ